MNANVDLQQLVIDRPARSGPAGRPARLKRLGARYLLPGALVLGFVLVIAWAARDVLLPATPVTVVPVAVGRSEVQQAGAVLFQAAGWIEPRPTPVLGTALTEGVIERLLVVEGQEVSAEQALAHLVDADARLALDKAGASLALAEAELSGAAAELKAAELRLKQPVHLEAALAEADSLLARAETDRAKLPFELRAAEARLKLAEQELEGKKAAGEAVAGRLIQRAQQERDTAASQLEELRQRQPHLERLAATLQARRAALARQLELRVEESRQQADAQSKLKVAEAKRRQAELAQDSAKLNLRRMVVRSPVAGRVLKLLASPGTRLGGPGSVGSIGQDAGAVVSLYDPRSLQARVDVRLEDVGRVWPGQPVRIETASVSAPIEGEVLHVTSSASVQKNTLEVKVALKSPPAAIRPEMLVQAAFLAPAGSGRPSGDGAPAGGGLTTRILVPRTLVEKTGQGAWLWLAEAGDVARHRAVTLGTGGTADLIEVLEGLQPTDKIIAAGLERLRDGQRIRITGED